MPIFDVKCINCGNEKEILVIHNELKREMITCNVCGGHLEKIAPQKSPSFTLKYNNQTDMCDWDGNTSQYWKEYKEAKAKGLDVRIPKLDGDG